MAAGSRSTASRIARAFVKGDEEHAAVTEGGRPRARPHHGSQPGIAGRDRAVVHVVAHVWRDPDEIRNLAAAHVSGELGAGNNMRRAARSVGADVGVV